MFIINIHVILIIFKNKLELKIHRSYLPKKKEVRLMIAIFSLWIF